MDYFQRQASEFNLQSINKSYGSRNNTNSLITLSFPLNFNKSNVSAKSLNGKSRRHQQQPQPQPQQPHRTSLSTNVASATSESLSSRDTNRLNSHRTMPILARSFAMFEPSRLNEIRNDLLNSYNSFNCNELINTSINSKLDIHQKIIDIGENLHESISEQMRHDYEQKLNQAKEEMAANFEKEKLERIEVDKQEFNKKLCSLKNEIKAEYHQMLQDKISESAAFSENMAREQIELYKIEARSNLQEELKRLREQFEPEKQRAVNEAIIMEKQLANKQLDDQRLAHEKKLADVNNSWSSKMVLSLREQESRLKSNFEIELKANNDLLNKAKLVELEELSKRHQQEIDKLKSQIELKIEEINKLNLNIIDINAANDDLKLLLEELRLEFKSCIQRFTHLNKEEAEFLFPIFKPKL